NLANHVPVGKSAVTLDASAAVNGHHRSAGVFDYLCDLDRIDRAFVPPDSDLHRDRDRDRLADTAQYFLELRQIAKQRRPAAAFYYSFGRAAAVDIDYVGA